MPWPEPSQPNKPRSVEPLIPPNSVRFDSKRLEILFSYPVIVNQFAPEEAVKSQTTQTRDFTSWEIRTQGTYRRLALTRKRQSADQQRLGRETGESHES